MADVLAEGTIRIGIDDSGLQQDVPKAIRTIKEAMTPLKNTIKETFSDQLRAANIAAIKLKDAFGGVDRAVKSVTSSLREATKASLSLATQQKLYGNIGGAFNYAKESGMFGKIASGARTGVSVAGAGVGVATGLTFAAAASAGSTTFDTLTGSLRMLQLAAGAKTQDAVLGLSRKIQEFAKAVDKAPTGAVGGYTGSIAGAAAGGAMFGVPGALGGAIVGGIAGYFTEKKFKEQNESVQLAIKALKGGGANADELIKERSSLQTENKLSEQQNGFFNFEAANKRKKNMERIEQINEALKKAESPEFRKQSKEFLTAGLGAPASYSGLADVRQQAQLAGFDKSALDLANAIRELNLNIKALGNGIDNAVANNQQNKNVPARND